MRIGFLPSVLSRPSFVAVVGAVVLASANACVGNDSSLSDPAPQPGTDAGATASLDGGATVDGGANAAGGAFQPSNVPAPTSFEGTGDVQISKEECELSGDERGFENCGIAAGDDGTKKFTFARAKQADGSEVALFTVRSLTVNSGSKVRVSSTLPVVIVAERDIDVQGAIVLQKLGDEASGGGFGPSTSGTGGGPGGGSPGAKSQFNGGAGGSYCGRGGSGGGSEGAASPGASYGKPEIAPLMGGSAGGNEQGGRGGGAIQLSAGGLLTIGTAGLVYAGGDGGGNSGGGGGSGGAILIEGSTVRVLGTLAANGGGGNVFEGLSDAEDGQPRAVPAKGIRATAGDGSAAGVLDGTNGGMTPGDVNTAGGGGGGAGRIRINTASGAATIESSAVVTPSLATPCATQGKISSK